jgi:pimeloyl-ACP methyl ester carboxylesterase
MAQLALFGQVPRPLIERRFRLTTTASTGLPAFASEAGRARYLAAYDAVLAAWPVPYEEIGVPTRLGPTHIVASGPPDAPPLVLLPSLAGTATVWRLNVEALSRRFRTYAVDVIGQPGKSVATKAPRDAGNYAAWLGEVLDGLGLGRASLVGCSFGGFLALNQALMTPERVDRVVLIGPVGCFVSSWWRLFVAMRVRAPLTRLARRFFGGSQGPAMTDLVRRAPRDMIWAALMGVTMAERPKLAVINPTVFSARSLKAVRAPVLLLIGEHETLYDPAETLRLAQGRVPGLTGAVIPDADHIAAMAQPDEVCRRVLAFLGG